MSASRQATAIVIGTGTNLSKLLYNNTRLNFEEYIIRINHFAIHKELNITCQIEGLYGIGYTGEQVTP